MASTFAATVRRAMRLMRPAKLIKTNRVMQQAIQGQMAAAVLGPLSALTPKSTKARKGTVAKAGGSLGAVVARLLLARTGTEPSGRQVPRLAKGAQFLTRTHRNAAGSRAYKIYIPARTPKGLILMLHGCNQTPDDFAIGTHMNALAEKHGLVIAYPAQTKRHNAAACWNWFQPEDQARGHGEPAVLASLARKLAGEFGVSRQMVFVAGLSAGGAMAAILADVYPDVFSAAGIHSGLARGSAQDVMSAMSAMQKGATSVAPAEPPSAHLVRRILFQGDADRTVHVTNTALIITAALGQNPIPSKTTQRSTGGRGYVRSNFSAPDGTVLLELWMLQGGGHAWSGGRIAGSYTDPTGPDASAQIVRFFLTKTA